MSEPLMREQFEVCMQEMRGEVGLMIQLCNHDAALRQQLATVTQERDGLLAVQWTAETNAQLGFANIKQQLAEAQALCVALEEALKEAHDILHDGKAFYPLKAIGVLKFALALTPPKEQP